MPGHVRHMTRHERFVPGMAPIVLSFPLASEL